MDIALAMFAGVALAMGLLMLVAASRLQLVRRRAEELDEQLRQRTLELDSMRDELAIAQDDLEAAQADLQGLELTDPLTGLKNRRYFCETVAAEVARIERAYGEMLRERRTPTRPANLGFILIDVDDFRAINEKLGAAAGDELLRKIGVVLRRHLRRTDQLIRWGGDEFLGVCDDIRRSAMKELTNRVAKSIRETRFAVTSGQTVTATVSVAYSFYPLWETGDDDLTYEDVIAVTEKALALSKAGGPDTVVGLLKGTLPVQVDDVALLKGDLQLAISKGLVRLFKDQTDLEEEHTET